MKNYLSPILITLLMLIVSGAFGQEQIINNYEEDLNHEECTIGVAAGSATSDGRPMVWKTRDYSSAPNNEIKYNTSFKYKFISVSNAGDANTYAWMGLNEHGFAIVNTLSSDLTKGSTGPSNGALMRDVLGNCRTVAEFRHYLDSTNRSGRQTHADFGVIDSTGVAAIFETAGNQYWEYNADDSPHGYVIRTNFSMTGGGSSGIERYNRSSDLVADFYAGDSLNVKSILRYQMRDFSDFQSNPVDVPYKRQWSPTIPYGYINASKSICRSSSVSTAVIHGVLSTELAGFSTLWSILGQPASTVALPYWPVANTPPEADGEYTAPLCDISRQIRSSLFSYNADGDFINTFKLRDGAGAGLWSCTFPFEDSVLMKTTSYLDSIRGLKSLPVASMHSFESELAKQALARLNYCHQSLLSTVNDLKTNDLEVYPNPLINRPLNIRYSLTTPAFVRLELYDEQGRKIFSLEKGKQNSGMHQVQIEAGQLKASGMYLLLIRKGNDVSRVKVLAK